MKPFNLRDLRIRARLLASFTIIIVLVSVGSVVGLWQLTITRNQALHLHQTDLQAAAILEVYNHTLLVANELQRAAEARDAETLNQLGSQLNETFLIQIDETITILSVTPESTARNSQRLSELRGMRVSLPTAVNNVIELAKLEDWAAVQLRLENQVRGDSRLAQNLAQEITSEVEAEQILALNNMSQAQTRAFTSLIITAFATVLAAVWLAYIVTRSIAQPLSQLDMAAKALGRREFDHQIDISGNDELTYLARAIDDAASELAQLYSSLEERVRQRTEELHQRALQLQTSMAVGQNIISILDLNTLLREVTKRIQENYGYYYVAIFLLNDDQTRLQVRASTSQGDNLLRFEGIKLYGGERSIAGWVAENRQAALVNDVHQDSRYRHQAGVPNTQSQLALPLEMGGNLLGVLDIESDERNAFAEEDMPVLQLLANQVAIAINNASLYQGERSRRHFAETLFQVGKAVNQTLDLREVLNLILEQLSAIVPYGRASVMIHHATSNELELLASHGFPNDESARQIRIPIQENDVFHEVYQKQKPLLIKNVQARKDWQHVAGLPEARVWLGLPLIRLGEVIGMLSVTREVPIAYSEDDVTLAAAFAAQAAIALENARLYDQITRFSQELEQKVEERTAELQIANQQLERLNRTKSDFITVASHELRTPLTVLHGYSQLLLKDPTIQSNQFHHEMMASIYNGAVRLYEIVNSMLDVAKIDSRSLKLYPEPLSVYKLIQQECDKYADSLTDRKLNLTIAENDLPAIEADPEALRKVFHQIIGNAIKYTPDGGHITISGTAIHTQNNQAADYIQISIKDTGIGINPEFQELIFTKFYQTGELALHSTGKTKFKGGGPGLGLAIAQGIVAAHQGKLWVDSVGQDETNLPGSTFHILLPVSQEKPEADTPAVMPQAQSRLN
jgi:signal transduction histidine kinase